MKRETNLCFVGRNRYRNPRKAAEDIVKLFHDLGWTDEQIRAHFEAEKAKKEAASGRTDTSK